MIMTLPDGTTFKLIPIDEITLNDLVLVQKTTGIGPTQLSARLYANMARGLAVARKMQQYQEATAADDPNRASAAAFVLEAAVNEGDADVFAEAVHIWLSRRAAGESDLSLEQACDFPLAKAIRELEPDELAAAERERVEAEKAAADPTSPPSVNGRSPAAAPNRQTRRAAAKKSTSKST